MPIKMIHVCALLGSHVCSCQYRMLQFLHATCSWVHVCMCVFAGMHQLIAEWLVKISNSSVGLHSNNFIPSPIHPPPPFFACECLNLQRNLKSFSMLSNLLYLRPQCVCWCVCICYLWIPQRRTYERRKERKIPPTPLQFNRETQRSRNKPACELYSMLIILMFLL